MWGGAPPDVCVCVCVRVRVCVCVCVAVLLVARSLALLSEGLGPGSRARARLLTTGRARLCPWPASWKAGLRQAWRAPVPVVGGGPHVLLLPVYPRS